VVATPPKKISQIFGEASKKLMRLAVGDIPACAAPHPDLLPGSEEGRQGEGIRNGAVKRVTALYELLSPKS
jgi:hypothetical protein